MSWRVLTIKDLEYFYTGALTHPFLNPEDLQMIAKDVGTVGTALGTPYFNVVYGYQLWLQLNREMNAFAMLPKTTWARSGWRVVTAWGTTANAIATSETGALPQPTYTTLQVLKTTPKVQALSFELSTVLEDLAGLSQDDIAMNMHNARIVRGMEFGKLLNQQLLLRAIGRNASDSYGVSDIPNNLLPIDLIVSGYPESTLAVGGSAIGSKVNVYGADRSTAASVLDAYVDYSSDGTNRTLTDAMIRNAIQKARARGGNPTVVLTGYDTFAAIQGLYMTFIRYLPMSETQITFTMNGVSTAEGANVGIKVAALYGLPLITSVDTPSDPNGIQRIYILDTSDVEGYGVPRAGISVLRPIEYFEGRDIVYLGKSVIRGVYRFVGDTVFRHLAGQAKIRDITA